MVFQGYSVSLAHREKNVMFGLRNQGFGDAEASREVLRMDSACGLEKFANVYPDELSGGMKQRVAIARALAAKPRILLMDEPFGAFWTHKRDQKCSPICEIWRHLDITVLFITHDLDEAIYLADRILVLDANPGRVMR